MKYEVGDKVKVRGDLVEDLLYGTWRFEGGMVDKRGATLIVVWISAEGYYRMSDGSKWWTDEMLEDVEEDKKEDVKFEKGKWYKSNVGSETFYYIKVNHFNGSEIYGERICTSEPAPEVYIKDDYWDSAESINQALKIGPLIDLSEIQQYLPEGHADKVSSEKQSKEALLEEAKRRYPVGTRFISVLNKQPYTVKTNSHKWCNNGIDVEGVPWVYLNGKWAEIVESPTVQQKITPNDSAIIGGWYPMDNYDRIYTTGLDHINDESSKNKGESKSPTNESDFPIISTKRIINFSQLT